MGRRSFGLHRNCDRARIQSTALLPSSLSRPPTYSRRLSMLKFDRRATLQQPAEPGYSARLREQPVSYSSAVNQILSHHRWNSATFPPVTVTS